MILIGCARKIANHKGLLEYHPEFALINESAEVAVLFCPDLSGELTEVLRSINRAFARTNWFRGARSKLLIKRWIVDARGVLYQPFVCYGNYSVFSILSFITSSILSFISFVMFNCI